MSIQLNFHLRKKEVSPPSKSKGNLGDVHLIDPFGNLDFGVGKVIEQLNRLGVSPSETAIDLLILAFAVHVADTSIARNLSPDRWTRQITLNVPVNDVKKWSAASGLLQKMLRFLTGDHWQFEFTSRPSGLETLNKSFGRLDLTDFDCVTLFSGGLDSLIGTIDLLRAGRKPVLVSHYWDGGSSAAQKALLEKLKEKISEESFEVVRAKIGIRRSDLSTAGSENTQRSRSFLFYSMATLVVNALSDVSEVIIPENGLIALNVPMDPWRLGSLSTKTAHPHFIEYMAELSTFMGLGVGFRNPYGFKTKGQMVEDCKDKNLLERLLPSSMSCSSPAKTRWEKSKPMHCGYCVPCIIRRAALRSGLKNPDRTEYFTEKLSGEVFDSKTAKGRDIRSFIFAINRVLESPGLARLFVKKQGPLKTDRIEDYADVYLRGLKEVSILLADVKSKH